MKTFEVNKMNAINNMVDRNIRFQILEKEIVELISKEMTTEDKIKIWKEKIAKLANKVYYQDLLQIKLASRYRKQQSRVRN